MTSWTYEVRRSFNFLKRNKILDDEYVFIDVGCGKGKVCLLWAIFERKNNRSKSSIIGLDYYEHFVAISRENHLKLFGTPGFFLNVDATDFDFSSIKGQVIVYLYNPFDQKVLKQVVDNLPVNTIIIYNNPVHIAVFSQGYEVIYQHIGWHPNVQTTIIKKTTSSSLQP